MIIEATEFYVVQTRADAAQPWADAREFADDGEAFDWADYLREDGEACARVVRRWSNRAAPVRGEALRRAAKTPPKICRSLREEGLRQGADPMNWLGHVGALSVDSMTAQVMDDAGNWEAVSE